MNKSKQHISSLPKAHILMLRKLAAVALCASSIATAFDFAQSSPRLRMVGKSTTNRSDRTTTIAAKYLFASSLNYSDRITHNADGFAVDGKLLENHELDPSLRNVTSHQQLKNLFKSDRSKLLVNGARYKLERYEQLKGGGVIGATLGGWFGYGAVNGVAQGAVYAVCLPIYAFNPALGYVVNAGAAAVVNALVQPVAITAAVGCAIAGGVATGPV